MTEPQQDYLPGLDDPLVGQLFEGRYQILAVLGQGGMGTVYKARHVHMDKTYAIKTLVPGAVNDDNSFKRFEQEAKAAASLSHPNTIAVTDFGKSQQGLAFLVMEFLSGHTLEDVLVEEDEPMDMARFGKIFTQVCDGMQHAHKKGIIHRDLKPSNLMLIQNEDETDFVKIVDFGLAKFSSTESQNLTQTGMVMGSPPYMSPEQCRGDELDWRSDIYSLGCVMYATLTGQVPLKGNNSMATIFKHISDTPRPMSQVAANLKVTPLIEQIVMKTLEKDPANRPQTMAELGKSIKDAVDTADKISAANAALNAAAAATDEGDRTRPVRAASKLAPGNFPDEMAAPLAFKPAPMVGPVVPASVASAGAAPVAAPGIPIPGSIVTPSSNYGAAVRDLGAVARDVDPPEFTGAQPARTFGTVGGGAAANLNADANASALSAIAGKPNRNNMGPLASSELGGARGDAGANASARAATNFSKRPAQAQAAEKPPRKLPLAVKVAVGVLGIGAVAASVWGVSHSKSSVRDALPAVPAAVSATQPIKTQASTLPSGNDGENARQDRNSLGSPSTTDNSLSTSASQYPAGKSAIQSSTVLASAQGTIPAASKPNMFADTTVQAKKKAVKPVIDATKKFNALKAVDDLRNAASVAAKQNDLATAFSCNLKCLEQEKIAYGALDVHLLPTLAHIIGTGRKLGHPINTDAGYVQLALNVFDRSDKNAVQMVNQTDNPDSVWRPLAWACYDLGKNSNNDNVKSSYARWSFDLYTLAYNAWDRPRRGDDYVRLLQNYCDAANSDNELATVARLNNEIRKAGGNPVAANAQAGRQGFIKRMFNRDQKSSWGAPWRR